MIKRIFKLIKEKRKAPIAKNMYANLFGVIVNLLNQIVLVPLFLLMWPMELYGDWIILSSFSVFFSMTDLGFNSASMNYFSIKYAEGKYTACFKAIINNYILISVISVCILLLTVSFVCFCDIVSIFNLHSLDKSKASIIFVLLTFYVLEGMFSTIPNAIYMAKSKMYEAYFLDNLARIIEVIIIVGSLFLKLSLIWMVTIYCLPKIILLIYKLYDTNKLYHLRISNFILDKVLLKELFVPSLTFMTFPLGNALMIQGFNIIINTFFGASSLILFSTTRTLINFIKTFINSINTSVWPEFALAYGRKDYNRMISLHRSSVFISNMLCLIISIFIIALGKYIFQFWLQGKIDFNFSLLLALIIAFNINNLWNTSSVALVSTNNHSKFGLLYVGCTLLSVGIVCLISVNSKNLSFVAFSTIIGESILASYLFRQSILLTHDSVSLFVKDYINKIRKIVNNEVG